MDFQINPKLLETLERVAQQQQRSVDNLIEDAIEAYLTSRHIDTQFMEDVDRIIHKHQRLLDELAKR